MRLCQLAIYALNPVVRERLTGRENPLPQPPAPIRREKAAHKISRCPRNGTVQARTARMARDARSPCRLLDGLTAPRMADACWWAVTVLDDVPQQDTIYQTGLCHA